MNKTACRRWDWASSAAVAVGVLAVPLPYYVVVHVGGAAARGDERLCRCAGPDARRPRASRDRSQPASRSPELDDVDARLVEQRLAGQREQLAVRIESIRQRAHTDDQALLELSHAEEALGALDMQLARRRKELARLTVRAPVAGSFVPPPSRPADAGERTQLAAWSGRPLDVPQRRGTSGGQHAPGAHRPAGPARGDSGRAAGGNGFRAAGAAGRAASWINCRARSLAGRSTTSRRGAEGGVAIAFRRRGGGELATRTTADGLEKPLGVVYQASVPLDDATGRLLLGGTGTAEDPRRLAAAGPAAVAEPVPDVPV